MNKWWWDPLVKSGDFLLRKPWPISHTNQSWANVYGFSMKVSAIIFNLDFTKQQNMRPWGVHQQDDFYKAPTNKLRPKPMRLWPQTKVNQIFCLSLWMLTVWTQWKIGMRCKCEYHENNPENCQSQESPVIFPEFSWGVNVDWRQGRRFQQVIFGDGSMG